MRRRNFIQGIVGSAITWPFAARAQQPAMPVIGFLSARSEGDSVSVVAAFRSGLSETGYAEGRNVRITFRWADGNLDRLPTLATELVERHVDVIAAVGGEIAAHAAKSATKTIPVVFVIGTDPAKTGLVASINRPGNNVTGVTLYTIAVEQKRLELLRQLVPAAATFAVLVNPKQLKNIADARRADMEAAARSLGQKILIIDASNDREIEAAFATIVQMKIGALLVGTDPLFSTHRDPIIALAARHAVPAIFDSRIQVAAGGLISYGTSYTETYRAAGIYTGRILKGTKPADLPVLLPTKFELVINIKTAKALGLRIPDKLLALANEVIE
jgi:putative tryptophan/tyrosine transport system substrate-binding protein